MEVKITEGSVTDKGGAASAGRGGKAVAILLPLVPLYSKNISIATEK